MTGKLIRSETRDKTKPNHLRHPEVSVPPPEGTPDVSVPQHLWNATYEEGIEQAARHNTLARTALLLPRLSQLAGGGAGNNRVQCLTFKVALCAYQQLGQVLLRRYLLIASPTSQVTGRLPLHFTNAKPAGLWD